MSTNRSTGALARDIRERLVQAQSRDAGASPDAAAPPADTGAQLRVTKDGRLVRPGMPLPTDERGNPVAHSIVPDATFHQGAVS